MHMPIIRNRYQDSVAPHTEGFVNLCGARRLKHEGRCTFNLLLPPTYNLKTLVKGRQGQPEIKQPYLDNCLWYMLQKLHV